MPQLQGAGRTGSQAQAQGKPARASSTPFASTPYVLAFDTSNEMIAIGLGVLRAETREVELLASEEAAAHRASNTQLLPRIDALLEREDVAREQLACVAVGRGPGSFTGVRIAMATAKGIASALEAPLVGLSTLDAVAWKAWADGVRGDLAVVADAMRKEVYPVRYRLGDSGIERLEADRVLKAEEAAGELRAAGAGDAGAGAGAAGAGETGAASAPAATNPQIGSLFVTGDALCKYRELFEPCGEVLEESLWTPTGRGLLLALQAAWRAGEADPFDAQRHDPAFALPVYTRLSDAEENERIRLSKNDPKNLKTGVQDVAPRRDQRASMNDTAILNARPDAQGITYKPLDAAHAGEAAALDARLAKALGTAGGVAEGADVGACIGAGSVSADGGFVSTLGSPVAWDAEDIDAKLKDADRSLWSVYGPDDQLAGYACGAVAEGRVLIERVGVDPGWRRRGIARELVARVASDARDLGASLCVAEVPAGDEGAQAFCQALGLHVVEDGSGRDAAVGGREGEGRAYEAIAFEGPLPIAQCDVAGMRLHIDEARDSEAPRGHEPEALAPAAEEPVPAAETPAPGAAASSEAAPAAAPAPAALASSAAAPAASGPAAVDAARPLILAIESSCDETAAAITDGDGNLISDVVASQIDFHARFGGVVPEIASRKHIEAICGVCDECLDVAALNLGVARLTWRDLDAVAVTYAPGLVGALVVGVAFGKGAAWAAGKPFIGVNHLEGHLYANKIGDPDFQPPAVVSLVSGGNTMLVHMKDWGDYETLGATIDDAVGEAFDKVAKALGLGYPGGPAISEQAKLGDPKAIHFPRAMMHSGDLRFSLSGLKTAVVNYINNERAAGHELNVPDICASFQQAVVDVQIAKARTALEQTGAPTFCLGGGVAANPALREAYEQLCEQMGVRLVMPPLSACGDNAGMIALVALDRYHQGKFFSLDADAQAHANLDEPY